MVSNGGVRCDFAAGSYYTPLSLNSANKIKECSSTPSGQSEFLNSRESTRLPNSRQTARKGPPWASQGRVDEVRANILLLIYVRGRNIRFTVNPDQSALSIRNTDFLRRKGKKWWHARLETFTAKQRGVRRFAVYDKTGVSIASIPSRFFRYPLAIAHGCLMVVLLAQGICKFALNTHKLSAKKN